MELYTNIAVITAILLGIWLILELKHKKRPISIVVIITVGVVIVRTLSYLKIYVLKVDTLTSSISTVLSLIIAGLACFTYIMSIILLYFTDNDWQDRHDNDVFS